MMTPSRISFQKSSPRSAILMAHSIFSFPNGPLARIAPLLGVLGSMESWTLEALSPPCMRDFTSQVPIAVDDIVMIFKGIQ